jgi:hypothetical protein
MSATIDVPADVPLDFHSSLPFTPSLARKNSVSSTAVREAGEELPPPDTMSRTRYCAATLCARKADSRSAEIRTIIAVTLG